MKQIYYLSSLENEHRFDTIFDSVDGVTVFHDTTGIPSLVSFVQRDRAINNQNVLVIDVREGLYSNAHVISAVQFLRKFTVAELIFVGGADEVTTQLFGSLSAGFRVKSLIVDTGEAETQEKLRAILEGRSSVLAYTENILAKAVSDVKSVVTTLQIPPGQVINVGVAGAMGRCGTTTQVFAIARLPESIGFRPAVYDAGGKMTQLLKFCYGDVLEEDEYGDIHLYGISICRKWNERYTAYIRDCEVLSEANTGEWAESDISVLVTPTKPWELERAVRVFALAQKAMPDQMLVMAAFTDEKQADEVAPIFGDMMLLPWRADVWDRGIPSLYQETFLPLLRRVCGCD